MARSRAPSPAQLGGEYDCQRLGTGGLCAAPHKLYLGCRYSTPDPFAVYPAERYVDVMSFNYYRRDVTEFDHLPVEIDKPVLVGEFHFGALDRGPIHPGCIQVEDKKGK